MRISVIVPTLDEEEHLGAALASIGRHGPEVEVIVSDGGSSDGTLASIPESVRIVRGARGRANQMNAAALVATGDVLLFLHADCRLPPGALQAALLALQDRGLVGGAFHKRWDDDRWLLGRARLRTSTWFRAGALLGDQALFVRAETFREMGGFAAGALAEDLDFSRRLLRRGRVVLLAPEVVVSARRLHARGIAPTWARWWTIAIRQLARGATDPPAIAGGAPDGRDP